MLRSVELKDYMLPDPYTVKADDDLFDAIHIILVNKISGICVVDETNTLVGVLSELDCLRAALKATYAEVGVGAVKTVMSTDVISARIGEDIVDVATDMLKNGHRRRPVIDDKNKLLGQITCRRLLKAVKEFGSPPDPSEHNAV